MESSISRVLRGTSGIDTAQIHNIKVIGPEDSRNYLLTVAQRAAAYPEVILRNVVSLREPRTDGSPPNPFMDGIE